jgi:hypothetical protein
MWLCFYVHRALQRLNTNRIRNLQSSYCNKEKIFCNKEGETQRNGMTYPTLMSSDCLFCLPQTHKPHVWSYIWNLFDGILVQSNDITSTQCTKCRLCRTSWEWASNVRNMQRPLILNKLNKTCITLVSLYWLSRVCDNFWDSSEMISAPIYGIIIFLCQYTWDIFLYNVNNM